MKALFSVSLATLLMSTTTFSQACNMALKDGAKASAVITTFTNPHLTNTDFPDESDEKKAEQITAYNADVMSGKIAAASNYPMVFNIKKTTTKAGDEYSFGYKVGEIDYFSYVVCNKLKVGDVLPSFEDIGIVFPTTTDMTVKKNVFSHYDKSWSRDFGFYKDSQTGQSGFGPFDKMTPKAVYNTIDVAVRQTISVSTHSIQGVNSRVTGEEEVTVSGVKYKAFVVESESWAKSNVDAKYKSVDEEVNQAQKELMEENKKYLSTMMIKKQFTNKLGYMVMYGKQWIVPQLGGSVKTVSYDIYGGIASIITTSALE